METENTNRYDHMKDYIESVFHVFQNINNKASENNNKKFKMISLIIYNYVKYVSKEFDVDLQAISKHKPEKVTLLPIFEYITANNIELYDFSKIELKDVDVTKKEDLERFVLSHIYYITQNK